MAAKDISSLKVITVGIKPIEIDTDPTSKVYQFDLKRETDRGTYHYTAKDEASRDAFLEGVKAGVVSAGWRFKTKEYKVLKIRRRRPNI